MSLLILSSWLVVVVFGVFELCVCMCIKCGKGKKKGGDSYRSLHQRLNRLILRRINRLKRLLEPQRHDPKIQAHNKRKHAADSNHVATNLEQIALHQGHGGDGEDKSGEDEDGVDDARGQGKLLVNEVARGVLAIGGRIVHDVHGGDGEAELHCARGEEEEVGHEGGDEDLVGHGEEVEK